MNLLDNNQSLRIGILGTRGIPNNYGGFEQFAENLSKGLVEKGNSVYVYNSHNHPYQEKTWNGVNIIHIYDPEYKIGTAGQFIYDLLCIMDARKRKFDVLIQLGYTSSSVWGYLLPGGKTTVTTNMDGLEWKRDKYSNKVKKFLEFAEAMGVKTGGYLISDSIGIQNYLKDKYKVDSAYIPYGSDLFENPDPKFIEPLSLEPYKYDLIIARLEPENSIEIILNGISKSSDKRICAVVGNHKTEYGEYLKKKFPDSNIKFLGGIYDKNVVNNLRYFSNIYFHGHTVGGTNPSLLEAMGANCLICANDNEFNKHILNEDAYYFKTSEDITNIQNKINDKTSEKSKLDKNFQKVKTLYSHDRITEDYLAHIKRIHKKN